MEKTRYTWCADFDIQKLDKNVECLKVGSTAPAPAPAVSAPAKGTAPG